MIIRQSHFSGLSLIHRKLSNKEHKSNMSRKKIVAANWKMNLTLEEGEVLVDKLLQGLPRELHCQVVIAPPAIHIVNLIKQLSGSGMKTAAQNCYSAPSGAFTGEISAEMLESVGVEYCLAGHSERRLVFNESNVMIKEKINAILRCNMVPVFCCGESLDLRESNQQNEFVRNQLTESLFHLEAEAISGIVIAYEPIWAIGTGRTASPEQAQEMHQFIRSLLIKQYGQDIGAHMRILYGGSIKPDNASVLFSQQDVDGGLVGGASLSAAGFLAIIEAANGSIQ